MFINIEKREKNREKRRRKIQKEEKEEKREKQKRKEEKGARIRTLEEIATVRELEELTERYATASENLDFQFLQPFSSNFQVRDLCFSLWFSFLFFYLGFSY